jgi:hypothetical protein
VSRFRRSMLHAQFICLTAGIVPYVCDVSDRKAVNKVALRIVQEARVLKVRSVAASELFTL